MDCKTTSISRAARQRYQAGATLLEMCLAITIGLLVIGTVASFSIHGGRSFAAMANYVEMETDSRNALDTMTRDIRQAVYLTSFTTNELTLADFDGQPLIFAYSAAQKTLSKIQ